MTTMTRPRVKLRVSDGQWEAEVEEYGTENGSVAVHSHTASWTGPLPVLAPEQRTALLEQLKAEPLDVYRLLQGEACHALYTVVQAAADTAVCSLEGDVLADDAKTALKAGLESEPLLCLELIGMTREALLEHIFSAWAGELSHVQGASPALEPTSRSESGRSGSAAIGDWIAESAAEGALHRPGAGFHAIEISLTQKLMPVNEADITALLPGLPRAEEALKLIRERVADRARAAIPQKRHTP
jgi:hypothetical protein